MIRHLHNAEGKGDPFARLLRCLGYTLKGIKRYEAEAGVIRRERLPISPGILRKIKAVWEVDTRNLDKAMLWAACCLGCFCFLRASEMTDLTDEFGSD